jgi:small subunit ribosomal protein S19
MANIIVSGKQEGYRGVPLAELKKMDIREFARLLNSRERRSVLRDHESISDFIKKAEKKIAKNKVPKTHTREMVIVPAFVGWTIGVHNGKEFVQVVVSDAMIGGRLGQYALTRRTVKHGAAGIGSTKGSSAMSVK